MSAYYNEFDPFAAAWLRELIKAGEIADGEVDERSIELVRPNDLRGFTQCHFFAGIGGWSLALRYAGWCDDRPVWTGSCPCQPFSSAGAQVGGNDSRDLWPVWFQLVKECRPVVVFGEQVEAAIGHGWLDRLCDDVEAEDYAVGACGLPGPCVGAFDIRQRLWFVADASDADRRRGERPTETGTRTDGERRRRSASDGTARDVAYAESRGQRIDGRASRDAGHIDERDATGDMGDTNHARSQGRELSAERVGECATRSSGMDGGFWSIADWLPCSDGKARPVEPGTFPLAHGVSARVGRLRGYGNAIKPQVAQVFIEAYMSARA